MAAASPTQIGKITVYWLEKSRAQRIIWLLEELGLEYELKIFKRGSDMLAPKELKDIHPLGKSPVIGIQGPNDSEEKVVAESAFIVEYVLDYFGTHLIPQRYPTGKDGQFGGESEEWMRYRYLMHFAEGTMMLYLVIGFVLIQLRGPAVPFFIRPITRQVAARIEGTFLTPNLERIFAFLESQISTSPEDGKFLCGPNLTGADIMISFPLEAALGRAGLTADKYPKLVAYVEMLHEREAYKNAIKRVEEATGEPYNAALS